MLFQLCLVLLAIFLWFKNRFNYWHKRGFPYVPGKIPLGSTPTAGISEHSCTVFQREYEKFKDRGPAFGVFGMAKPMLVPTDPDLIREIFVKNFEVFHERGFNISEEADPLSQHLSFKNGQEWKDLRSKLSQVFSSGKIKMMFPNVMRICDRMIDYLMPYAEKIEPLEMKDVYCSFTTEVISDCAFGITADCLGNPDNEFKKCAKKIFEPTAFEMIKLMLIISFESVGEFFKIGFNGKEVTDFIMKVVRQTLDYREKNNVERNDFFQLLMNMKKTGDMTFNDIAANSFVFFLAGFETSSSVMTFSTYELALNQDIQDRLRTEINEVIAKHNGEVTYESIMEMKYLDMVFNESLRKYPVVDFQIRQSVKDFPIANTNLVIPAKTMIIVPVHAIHNDEKYYENPDKFDPERFTDENVKKRHPFTYLPFSHGPRTCIGMRFGTLQTKIGLIKLLRNFRILPCSKTIIPMKFSPNAQFQSPLGGMWLKLEKI
ncbi:hypothetical protein PVAND_015293 [Polypedilum vanderplanki]|uniref:Cytochrome P450 n=1 Tax=Polypedilum vanderplanki TaxID=319348 RepID=A0A9J6BCN4_POLVA|nr:hypothetical protein PVAND_015293 [Polypedilum vanderplanki]